MRIMSLVLGFALLPVGSHIAAAEVRTYGDWTVNLSAEQTAVYSRTGTEGGSTLSEVCTLSDGRCTWSLVTDTPCEQSHSYHLVGNTNFGAARLRLTCEERVDENSYRYLFTSSNDLEALLKGSGEVGFAVPMPNDDINVLRFSLAGESDAMSMAESYAITHTVAGNQKGATIRN